MGRYVAASLVIVETAPATADQAQAGDGVDWAAVPLVDALPDTVRAGRVGLGGTTLAGAWRAGSRGCLRHVAGATRPGLNTREVLVQQRP